MRRPHAALTGTLLALSCALTACSGAATSSDGGAATGTTTPSAPTTSTSTVTTSSTGTTTPNSVTPSASVDPSHDPLYLEAVDVYTKYFKEMQKFEAAGYPTKTAPKNVTQYMTAPAIADLNSAISASVDAGEAPKAGHSTELIAIATNPGVAHVNSITSLRSCVDGRKVPVINPRTGAANGNGSLIYREIFFERVSKSLLIDYVDAKVVEKCPID